MKKILFLSMIAGLLIYSASYYLIRNKADQDNAVLSNQQNIDNHEPDNDDKGKTADKKSLEVLQTEARKAEVLGEKIRATFVKDDQENTATTEEQKTETTIVKTPTPKPKTDAEPIELVATGSDKLIIITNQDLLPPIRTILPPIYTSSREPVNVVPIPKESPFPSTLLISKPDKFSSSTIAEFVFGSDKKATTSFEYQIDPADRNDPWVFAERGVTFEDLPEGNHTIRVRAVLDYEDLIDPTPLEYSWSIDTTVPESDFVSTVLENNTLKIVWERSDTGIDKVFYNIDYQLNGGNYTRLFSSPDSTSYDYSGTFFAGDNIVLKLTACDMSGNCGTEKTAEVTVQNDHLVISALKLAGFASDDEVIELYNPTGADISLAGYVLKKRNYDGQTVDIVSDLSRVVIKGYSYLLVANPVGYTGRTPADLLYDSADFSIDNDDTILLIKGERVIDKVGLASSADYEGEPAADLQPNRMLVRKSDASGYMGRMGNGRDSDNNANDFEIANSYVLHSGDSPIEPDGARALNAPALLLDYATNDTAALRLQWPINTAFGADSKYELKIVPESSCSLNRQWRSLLSREIAVSSQEDSASIQGLSEGTDYCASVRAFNGQAWSVLSQDLKFRTNCLEHDQLLDNYNIFWTRASNSSAPEEPAQQVLVFDFWNDALANYDLYGGLGCGSLKQTAVSFNDASANTTRIEFAYDPDTLLFTGKMRYCHDGVFFGDKPIEGDHCADSASWFGLRWITVPGLAGQSTISLKRQVDEGNEYSDRFTEWFNLQ